MKKLLLLLLLAAPAARAQSFVPPALPPPPRAALQGGLLFGHDLFRVTNQQPAFAVGQYRVVPRMTTPSPGFRIGFWGRYNFGPERRWLLQPELSYSRNQSWHRVTNTAAPAASGAPTDFSALSTAQDWQRLNVCLPLGFRIGQHLVALSGPVLAVRIPTSYERNGQDYAIVQSINSSMRRLGVAWQAGVGYEMGRVLLTARYERSVLRVARNIELNGREYPFRHFASQISFGMALRIAPLR